MKNEDVLHLLLPGLTAEGVPEFYDFTGGAAIVCTDRFILEITADFPAAMVRFDIELKPGAFDYDTLYCEMTEYPSGNYVKTGPWDLAMDPPLRMQVPTLDVFWRGEHYGNLWFEMPSPEDIREKRLGGVFALPFFETPGRQTVRLVVPEAERKRLDFAMIEKIVVRLDNRAVPVIEPRSDWNPDAPWLFLGDRRAADLPCLRAGSARDLWARMDEGVDRYFETGETPVRGMMMLANAAFMALAKDDDGSAMKRIVTLLEERRQSDTFLDSRGKFMFMEPGKRRHSKSVRWLMGYGWNDYGFSWILLENACVYQWLKSKLPPALRDWLKGELVRYGREAYRFIVFQRQYTGGQGGLYNNHVTVPILAVAVLGAVLFRDCPEARTWLNFGCGRLREMTVLMDECVVRPSQLYWISIPLFQVVEFLRAITGEDHRDTPYMRMAPEVLWRLHAFTSQEGFTIIKRYYRRLTAACYASQLNSAESQWYYRRLRTGDIQDGTDSIPVGFLDVLWHTDIPGRPPEEHDRSRLFEDVSLAVLQTNYESPRFGALVGAGPFGRKNALTLESYTGCIQGNTDLHGGFSVWMRGVAILRQIGAYGQSFKKGNFVTVDGDGYFLGGAWLLGRADMSQAAWLRRADLRDTRAYLDVVNTRSYRPDLAMDCCRRRMLFDALGEWLLIVDDVTSRVDHDYALLLHAADIEALGAGRFRCFGMDLDRTGSDGTKGVKVGPLSVTCACDRPADCETDIGSLVMSYTAGVTQVKGGVKLSGDMKGYAAPVDRRIVCRPRGRSKAARFYTLVGTGDPVLTREGEILRVASRGSDLRIRLKPGGLEENPMGFRT